MPEINIRTYVDADKRIVFDLSRSIDLHEISTAHTNEKAIAGRTSGLIELNEQVTWRAKHLGVYQKLTVKITEFDFPHSFTDEMVKGAFKGFKHVHQFLDYHEDGTMMVDIFEYESPFGILGKLVDWLFLKKYMRNLLLKRNLIIKDFAESDKWEKVLDK